ncbi:hypothetical protein BH10ACI1_BH10ACI1_10860 [soil metagenome]
MFDKLPLTNSDLQSFADSFITPEIAEKAGLFRVDSITGAEMMLRKTTASSDYAGVIYPNFLPEQMKPREYRLRRDKPDLERKSDGAIKEKGKYLSPNGARNMIYFSPNCLNEYLADTSLQIVITEGEKKALVIDRVAWHGLTDDVKKPRFLALGLSGVWNFRGKVGIETTSDGGRQDLKGLIPDFHLIEWKKRKVTILFDANVSTNEGVKFARLTLGRELRALGANVFLADCPEIEGCNGIDDVLGKIEREHGTDAAVEGCFEILDAATHKAKDEKISQANQIICLAEGLELFHTSDGEAFASIEVGEHIENHRVNSKNFREWLSYQFYKMQGKSPSAQALQDAVGTICGQAKYEGDKREIYVRLASFERKIYLDLCNDEWQIIEIDADGWRIIEAKDAPVRFRRTKAMLALPTPARNGDIFKLRNFLNVNDENLILILAWLVNCFRPDYPFPIMIFGGEQGTAKSTSTKVLRELVDPSLTPFRSAPRDERDLIIAATNAWICAFDNLSIVPNWLSDALCRISTGGGFSTRTLYENDEETIFAAKRPIILNGIGDIANRGDLLDRALIVKLEAIPKAKRKPERQFWEEFEKEKDSIFSALLAAVSFALRNLENVSLAELPRLADFALWVTAAEQALGFEENSFMKAYTQNRENAHTIVLEDSILAEVLQELCEKNATDGKYEQDEVLLKDFLAELKVKADTDGKERSKDKKFPKTPKGLRNQIERINPNLREIGIFITFHGRTGGNANKGASLSLEYDCNQTSQTSQTSQSPENKAETSDVVADVTQNGEMSNITNITNQTSNITNTKLNGNNDLASKSDVSDVGDVTFHLHSNSNDKILVDEVF